MKILDWPAIIQLGKMWRRQSTIEMLKRKENFKRSGIKTTSPMQKTDECFTVIKKLYSKYNDCDWNLSVNSCERQLKIVLKFIKFLLATQDSNIASCPSAIPR